MTARGRYFVIAAARLVASAGAVLGVMLVSRATGTGTRLLGIAIVVSAAVVMATLPRHLARRWRTPPAS